MRVEPWLTNREQKRAPKLGKGWCDTCDACFKGCDERCQRCGAKPKRRRNRK